MDRYSHFQGQVAAEAADWFVRLQEPAPSPLLQEEFSQWLLRSPVHVEEFLAVTRAWGDLAQAPADIYSVENLIAAARAEPVGSNVISFGERPSDRSAERPAGLPGAAAAKVAGEVEAMSAVRPAIAPPPRRSTTRLAISIAAVAIGTLAYFAVQQLRGPPHIRTGIGEQRILTLADGSIVHLNTASDLTVTLESHERRIRLLQGEARFDVAKDKSRPFFVETSQATVRAVGTVFNVRAAEISTAVTVVEGRVEVVGHGDAGRSDPSPGKTAERASASAASTRIDELPPVLKTQLGAGERAAFTKSGQILPNTGPPEERVLAWSDQRLVFRDEALIDVVTEFNRYQAHPMRIADPALAAMSISGTFSTNDAASLLQYLERYHHVLAEESADGSRVLRLRYTPDAPAP